MTSNEFNLIKNQVNIKANQLSCPFSDVEKKLSEEVNKFLQSEIDRGKEIHNSFEFIHRVRLK